MSSPGARAPHFWRSPVFAHEWRGVGRFAERFGRPVGRRVSAAWLLATLVTVSAVISLLALDAGLFDGFPVDAAATVICLVGWLLAPAATSTCLVGERQRGSWEMLLTTPLRPAEIILGKLAGRLTGILLAGLVALPPLLACLAASPPSWDDPSSLGLLVGCVLIGPAAFLSLAVIGLVCSARCRSVAAATAWSYGLAIGLIAVVPMLEVAAIGLFGLYPFEPLLTPLLSPIAGLFLTADLFCGLGAPAELLCLLCGPFHILVAVAGVALLVRRFDAWLSPSGTEARRSRKLAARASES